MKNWEADFEAMNRKAGKGLRAARDYAGMSRKVLANHLGITIGKLRQYEEGRIPIEAAHLYYADTLFKSGYAFYFYPYCEPERFSNPMENVIRFPKRIKEPKAN